MALREVWPWGEVASVEEVESRLGQRSQHLWKVVADAAAGRRLLVDLERLTLDRRLLLALLPPDAAPLVPEPLASHAPEPVGEEAKTLPELGSGTLLVHLTGCLKSTLFL